MPLPALARTAVLIAAHSPISQLLSTLSAESQLLLRKLASLLQTPVDAPAVHAVVASAAHVVDSYGKTLAAPTAEFLCILRAVKALKDECDKNGRLLSIACDNPLRRRLTRSPAWALLIQTSRLATPEPLLIAAGVELAYCLAIGKPFPNGYATNLRRAISAHDVVCALSEKEVSEPPWRAHFAKATREARKIFESGAPPDDGKNANFAETVINEFRGAALLPSTRHRQALPDYEHLSSTILVEAAERLRRAASDGCDDSLLAIIAFVCGLSLRTIVSRAVV